MMRHALRSHTKKGSVPPPSLRLRIVVITAPSHRHACQHAHQNTGPVPPCPPISHSYPKPHTCTEVPLYRSHCTAFAPPCVHITQTQPLAMCYYRQPPSHHPPLHPYPPTNTCTFPPCVRITEKLHHTHTLNGSFPSPSLRLPTAMHQQLMTTLSYHTNQLTCKHRSCAVQASICAMPSTPTRLNNDANKQ